MNYGEQSLQKHKETQGKISIANTWGQITNKEELSVAYSPGVGAVAKHLGEHPEQVREYTIAGRTVLIVSDGSAVLGFGNIGPEGALPVMEGKALLLKEFAGIDAYPLVLKTQDTEELIRTIELLSINFAGINLEDISAPRCFEIEERLKKSLNIPVFHDDQHGTAIVVLAGLINACRVTGKELTECRVVMNGAGAAGVATAKLLLAYGVKDLIVCDSKGVIGLARTDLNSSKHMLMQMTNPRDVSGELADVVSGADVLIGLSVAGAFSVELVRKMKPDPIVFALANPDPEMSPEQANAAGVAVFATGRSDYPNQVNNVLAFPGVFKGLLRTKAVEVTQDHMLKAAKAIASSVPDNTLSHQHILPDAFDPDIVDLVARSFDE